jgi:hypothetical protein
VTPDNPQAPKKHRDDVLKTFNTLHSVQLPRCLEPGWRPSCDAFQIGPNGIDCVIHHCPTKSK